MTRDMRVLVRADASRCVGSGHVMRCLALAEAIVERGGVASFASRALTGDLRNEVRARGFEVRTLDVPIDADLSVEDDARATLALLHDDGAAPAWVVVDHYDLDARWHCVVAGGGAAIAVVDDLADRSLQADLLIDQNAVPEIHARYAGLCPPHCVMLLGPSYTLLRREFRHAHAERAAYFMAPPRPGKVLLFLGAADADGLTLELLSRLDRSALPGPLSVLVGVMNARSSAIEAWCVEHQVEFAVAHTGVSRLAASASAAIVSCGMFAVELQALQVPSLLLPLSDIQRTVAHRFATSSRAVVLEPASLLRAGALAAAVRDGEGAIALDGASRVIDRMWEIRS
jgi:UDP-2,4-diacetamido-2,4,6-trideoxy-beta-L-altropyranose hydrolase